MTPRERAWQFVNTVGFISLTEDQRINQIEAVILADRQALQSEIDDELMN